nr:MAG TPA: DNA polymerase I [Caudoviricetes sp.]
MANGSEPTRCPISMTWKVTMISRNEPHSRLVLDLETFSSADLPRGGVKKYTESPDFEILLMSYAWDGGPVQLWDFTQSGPPDWLAPALTDHTITKIAWNVSFERNCLNAALGIYTPPEQWRDAMTIAAMNGLPMSLDAAGAALQLQQQKLATGKALIRYFCMPCKPTISNGGRTRNLPEHAPDKWELFKEYCLRDTVVEQTIYDRLASFPVPEWERRLEALDAHINERGVLVDMELAESAVAIDERSRAQNVAEMQAITGLDNPGSVAQLKAWFATKNVNVDSLNKATVADLLDTVTDPATRRVLELRQLTGKTSTKKYQAILDAACADHRIRGLLQYYGAARTGRWAGRRVQLQNLAQNHLENIALVRSLVRLRDLETLEMAFDSVPDVLSQLIRTALVAKPGHTFLVADYSAIEARVVAWMAGEQWRMDVFAQGGDIYCSSASQMFHVPVVKHGVNGHLRQKGKIAELACGYGGGVGALKAFGADKMGLSEEEMLTIVQHWRRASPTIPRFWSATERAARSALAHPGKTFSVQPCGVKYRRDADALRCKLPSGRILSYWGANIGPDGHLYYMGQNQTTRKWERTETWGGKLVENIVQAVARDCLAVALLRLDNAGFQTLFTVHDEVIVEEPQGGRTWQDVAEIMGQPIDWAPGLLLRGDGYETPFYMKD